MNIRLVLNLPFGVTLVHNGSFPTEEAAVDYAKTLPGNFSPVKDTEALNDAVEVPFNETGRPDEIRERTKNAAAHWSAGVRNSSEQDRDNRENPA